MEAASKLINNCVRLLEQGAAIIRQLDDQIYTSTTPLSPRGSIAAHIRHILDFYDNFIYGISSELIDYNLRDRTSLVQQHCETALIRMEHTIGDLRSLNISDPEKAVMVSAEDDGLSTRLTTRSSVLRELDFLQSHTVHHYSVVALLLRLRGIEPGQEFGVAPSTINYLNQDSACAP